MSGKSSLIGAVLAGVMACGVGCLIPTGDPDMPTLPRVPAADLNAAVQGNNAFAIDLYRQLATKERANENIFFSPFSITAAMAMTYAGARGETATQMAKVLHFNADQDQFHPAFASFAQQIARKDRGSKREVAIANAIWVERTMPVQEPFQALWLGRRPDTKDDPEGAA